MGGGKYETQWEVKWKDWDKKHNTYDPIKNLAGCEDMIVEYRERKRQRESELEHSLDSGARALAVCSIQRRVMVTRWQRWVGGLRGGNNGPCRRPANLSVNVWVRGSNLLTGSQQAGNWN